MEFSMWSGLHREVGHSLLALAKKAAPMAQAKKATVGEHPYLWATALAAWMYERREALGVRPAPPR